MKSFILFLSCLLFVFISNNLSAQLKVTGAIRQTAVSSTQADPSLFLCYVDTPVVSKICLTKGCLNYPSKFNFNFAKNCYFCRSNNGSAVTPKYITIFDQRYGTVDYLKLKNGQGLEYVKVKKVIQPKANYEMFVGVVAKDTGYNIKLEAEEYYKEYQESFAKAIQDAKTTAQAASRTGSSTTTQTSAGTEEVNRFAGLGEDQAFSFLSLNQALLLLLDRYGDNAIITDQYFSDLKCLRLKISEHFGISFKVYDSVHIEGLIKETEEMYSLLKKLSNADEELSGLLINIKNRYLTFISRQLNGYRLLGIQIQIPDKDAMKFTLIQKTGTLTKNIHVRDFRISGGFKIDFSAGIFVTGLANPEFIAEDHKFRYQEANFTVFTPTGRIDTTFTGRIIDTTGKMIHTKNPLMNYAAGFLAHAYIRSGQFANLALATGLLANNDHIKILLGGSLMLGAAKSRISISSGLVIGNQKVLSPIVEPAVWNDSYKDGTIYRYYNTVPKFVLSADVPTYTRWTTSWFFGITYNFGSISIHW